MLEHTKKGQAHTQGGQKTSKLAQISLTLTAEQAILQVTEDSSFRVFWSKGTKSTRDRGLPESNRTDR